jgi:hypothetical protein
MEVCMGVGEKEVWAKSKERFDGEALPKKKALAPAHGVRTNRKVRANVGRQSAWAFMPAKAKKEAEIDRLGA